MAVSILFIYSGLTALVRKGRATSIFPLKLGMGWDCCSRERNVKVEYRARQKKLFREWAKIEWDFSGIPNLGILGFFRDTNPGILGFSGIKITGFFGFYAD